MLDKRDILGALGPEDAMRVLQELTKEPAIRKKAADIALAVVSDIDIDAVADEVLDTLESIAVEDVWDNSGRSRDGYVDPGDYAWQLFEEAIAPFEARLRKCRDLSLVVQAKRQCMGILKGTHRFASESTTEFKGWAVDAPGQSMARVFADWKKGSTSRKDIAQVKRFMKSLGSKTKP
jgi:hypothetical protein